jgi:hypothetical protein
MSHILLSVVMFVSVLMMNLLVCLFVVNCVMLVVDFAVMGFVMVMILLMLVMTIPLFVFMMMILLMLMVLVVLIFHMRVSLTVLKVLVHVLSKVAVSGMILSCRKLFSDGQRVDSVSLLDGARLEIGEFELALFVDAHGGVDHLHAVCLLWVS